MARAIRRQLQVTKPVYTRSPDAAATRTRPRPSSRCCASAATPDSDDDIEPTPIHLTPTLGAEGVTISLPFRTGDDVRHQNVIDHQGAVHEGLFNAHTGFLINLACGAGRFTVVHPYERLDPARLTGAPPTCPTCAAITSGAPGAPPHLADVTRAHAAAVIARADRRGHPPILDNEALRLAFTDIDPTEAPAENLYPLIREHLADVLTDRALTVPDGTPNVLVSYTRFTGGTVRAPVGVGDRLMYDGIASGHWPISDVTAVEDAPGEVVVTLREDNDRQRRWTADEVTRHFLKIDRAATPRAADQPLTRL
jgi:hypothetical protein